MTVFISYRHGEADETLVLSLGSLLQGPTTLVLTDSQIPVGATWANTLEGWLAAADVFIVILSRRSVASDNVRAEIAKALHRKNSIGGNLFLIIPIWLDIDTKDLPLDIAPLQKYQGIRQQNDQALSEDGYSALADSIRQSIAEFFSLPGRSHTSVGSGRTGKQRHRVSSFVGWAVAWLGMLMLLVAASVAIVSVTMVIAPAIGSLGVRLYESFFHDMLVEMGVVDAPRYVKGVGKDSKGNSVEFEFALVSAEYHWKQGSADDVESPGSQPESYLKYLESTGMQGRLSKHRTLVAIGLASCRGGLDEEAPRAEERARRLVAWLKSVEATADVNYLSLGQYVAPCENERAERLQRAIIVVGADKSGREATISEALRDAMNPGRSGEHVRIGVDVTQYTNWPSERFFANFR